jgi:transcriptional regulator with XRE-family HTH domain
MKIGRSIKIILEATKLTRGQLTARLKISRAYLSLLENNKCSGGNKMLKRITNTFNVPAIYVIAASDQNFRKQFPGTYRSIRNLIEVQATNRLRAESNPAA